MNLPNKITISRLIMSAIVLILLIVPMEKIGLDLPAVKVTEAIRVDVKYLIAGILFLIASVTDFIDGHIARKYNMVTDFGKVMDAIADKLLVNGVLIVLACNGFISIKMVVGSKIGSVGASKAGKLKTIFMMCGVTLMLFYNLPFEIWGIRVADTLIMIATVLSIISGIEYYTKNRKYLLED